MQGVEDPYRTVQELREAMDPATRKACSIRLLGQGDKLLSEGAALEEVFLILSGRLFVELPLPGGRVYDFVELGPGDFVGEYEAILGAPCSHNTVRAYTPCEAACIPLDCFMRWLDRDIGLSHHLLRTVTFAIDSLNKKFLRETSSEAMNRLAAYLLELIPDGAGEDFVLRRSRQDIALQTGVNVRTVNRAVRTLEDTGCLSVRRGKIHVSPEQAARLHGIVYLGKGGPGT